jgi:hypothetical protein
LKGYKMGKKRIKTKIKEIINNKFRFNDEIEKK